MGLWPTRANENPLDIRTCGHAMACPYNGRQSDFQENRRRRGISQCFENNQSEIPRFARNDSPKEVFTRVLVGAIHEPPLRLISASWGLSRSNP